MIIHLKKDEKLYLNGAVIKLDRRGSVHLMNDAQFLLEAHVMQAEDAVSPLRQVYFLMQSMLMDPNNAQLVLRLLQAHCGNLMRINLSDAYVAAVTEALRMAEAARYFEGLKVLRKSFHLDDAVLVQKPSPLPVPDRVVAA
jgi:flagellar protein FlbT